MAALSWSPFCVSKHKDFFCVILLVLHIHNIKDRVESKIQAGKKEHMQLRSMQLDPTTGKTTEAFFVRVLQHCENINTPTRLLHFPSTMTCSIHTWALLHVLQTER